MKKILLLLIVVFSITQAKIVEEYKLLTSDDTTLNASLTDKGFEFDGMKNRAVFLIVFGIQCPPCIEEIPHLIEAIKKHGDKLSIVAMEAQGYDNKEVANFKKEKKINYTLLSAKEEDNRNLFDSISDELKWKGQLPLFIGIDKNGEIKEVKVGKVSKKEIEELVKSLNK